MLICFPSTIRVTTFRRLFASRSPSSPSSSSTVEPRITLACPLAKKKASRTSTSFPPSLLYVLLLLLLLLLRFFRFYKKIFLSLETNMYFIIIILKGCARHVRFWETNVQCGLLYREADVWTVAWYITDFVIYPSRLSETADTILYHSYSELPAACYVSEKYISCILKIYFCILYTRLGRKNQVLEIEFETMWKSSVLGPKKKNYLVSIDWSLLSARYENVFKKIIIVIDLILLCVSFFFLCSSGSSWSPEILTVLEWTFSRK